MRRATPSAPGVPLPQSPGVPLPQSPDGDSSLGEGALGVGGSGARGSCCSPRTRRECALRTRNPSGCSQNRPNGGIIKPRPQTPLGRRGSGADVIFRQVVGPGRLLVLFAETKSTTYGTNKERGNKRRSITKWSKLRVTKRQTPGKTIPNQPSHTEEKGGAGQAGSPVSTLWQST